MSDNNDRHTPGPWIADSRTVKTESRFGPIIAVAEKVGPPDKVRSHVQGEVNARLIAAAPELLEAAREAERFLSNMESYKCFTPDSPSEAVNFLRSAINKAEGRDNPETDELNNWLEIEGRCL